MAYRQFQTAASRVVHLSQPNEDDVKRLATEFHFHPLDLEAVLSISPKPHVSSYRDYVVAALPWPVMENRRHSIMLSELQLFIGQNFLVIVDDGTISDVRDVIAQWEMLDGAQSDSPAMLAYDLVLNLTKATALAARHIPAAHWAPAIHPLVATIEKAKQGVSDQGWLQTDEQRSAWSYLTYSIKHLADDLQHQPAPVAKVPVKKHAMPSAVTSYAVASAIMTALVLLFVSFRR